MDCQYSLFAEYGLDADTAQQWSLKNDPSSITHGANKGIGEYVDGGEGVAKDFGLCQERQVEDAVVAADALQLNAPRRGRCRRADR